MSIYIHEIRRLVSGSLDFLSFLVRLTLKVKEQMHVIVDLSMNASNITLFTHQL